MDAILLKVKLRKSKGGILAGKQYYYPVPAFERIAGVITRMSDERAREIFLSDPSNYKKLLAKLPDECSAWIEFGDLIIPPPDDLPPASVLRVAHTLRADGSFDILAELLDSSAADKAYVQIVGLNGTAWPMAGKYPMGVELSSKANLSYSYLKAFTGLLVGNSIEYRVSVNDRIDFVSGQLSRENAQTTKGPTWGSWKPEKITPGEGYAGTLPADAATGTGAISYRLSSAPDWFDFSQNTRHYAANPTPSTVPITLQEVTFVASDQNGQTEKVFALEFVGQLAMYMGAVYQAGPGRLTLGVGPEDVLGYTLKLTCLTPGVNFTQTAAVTAEHAATGINAINYPYRDVRQELPYGTFLIEAVRLGDKQKRYALLEIGNENRAQTLTLSATPPGYTAPGFHPSSVGDIYRLVAVSQTTVERYIQLPASFSEAGNATGVFMERLSPSGETRKFVGGGTWNIPAKPSPLITLTPAQNDPATVVINAPQGSVSADTPLKVTFTPDDTHQVHEQPIVLKNVDPANPKPACKLSADDIYWSDYRQSKRVMLPAKADWFENSAGATLTAFQTDGVNKTPLPAGISFAGGDHPYVDITYDAPNVKVPLVFVCTNASGSDEDLIQLWVDRHAAEGKITGIWRSMGLRNAPTLEYYVRGTVIGNSAPRYRVRYRENLPGSFNGQPVPPGTWNPYLLTCKPGETIDTTDTTFGGEWGGVLPPNTYVHVEFQVYDTQAQQGVGPIIPLDYTTPANGTVIQPTRVYANP